MSLSSPFLPPNALSPRPCGGTGAEELKRQLHAINNNNLAVLGICLAVGFWMLEAILHRFVFHEMTFLRALLPTDPHELWMRFLVSILLLAFGLYANRIVNRLKNAETERSKSLRQLEAALTKVLGGFVPICANCKDIREGEKWEQMEAYISKKTEATFSHTVCPKCAKVLYPGLVV